MRWWEVSRRRGVPMVSHDGSGFDSHANVVLAYTCAWHRMTKLAVVRRDDPAGCRRQGDRKRVGGFWQSTQHGGLRPWLIWW
jgi:hypothetical protein